MKKQAFNPFLPLNVCIPDGEPHVFGDRVYLFGSHDMEGGYTFCMLDYEVYSAPVNDLSDWSSKGVNYKASQDPDYDTKKYMYAPDVVRGNDGKYYLYYSMSGDYGYGGYTGPISVAVADEPDGKYEYLGHVKYKDGTTMMKYVCFDPGVINDDGIIRVYYGTQYDFEERDPGSEETIQAQMNMFGRTREEITGYEKSGDCIMGPVMLTLEDDMLTVKDDPCHIIPYIVGGTDFEKHPFFEASSIRKIDGRYYFIYSSRQNHELCYATSDYPDRDFKFGGTIVSNGDIGFNGRSDKDRTNMTGTTHGSIECIDGQWYVFFHRLTHKSDYSRQACAEKIVIEKDGSIKQVEYTSCGLNNGPLKAEGTYPAGIACIISNGNMPHGCNGIYTFEFPNVNNKDGESFIAEVENQTVIGFKYFDFKGVKGIKVNYRTETDKNKVIFTGQTRIDERCYEDAKRMKENQAALFEGTPYLEIRLQENGESVGKIDLSDDDNWTEKETFINVADGKNGLFFIYHGKDRIQIKDIGFVV